MGRMRIFTDAADRGLRVSRFLVALAALCLAGCGGTDEGVPLMSPLSGQTLALVVEPTTPRQATDLAFHPTRDELWVSLREFYYEHPCTENTRYGCDALAGTVRIVRGLRTERPRSEEIADPNAWHFMRRPPALAFGVNDTWATCGEFRTGNYENDRADFMGPTLFSSDPDVFGIEPPGKNGSHLDMNHGTPYCMGIEHERENVYWAFNGQIGALDKYNFNSPHEIGGSDHRDGEIYRYVEGELRREPGVPSHLAFDRDRRWLYVADTGHRRVVRLDTTSGSPAGTIEVPDDMAVKQRVAEATLEVVVPEGRLQRPSGVAVHAGVVLVSDNATSRVYGFAPDGTQIGRVDTGLPKGSLAGIAVAPDGRLYLADMLTSAVHRLDP